MAGFLETACRPKKLQYLRVAILVAGSMVCCAFEQISAEISADRYLQISCHASRYLVTSADICHRDLIPADRRNVGRSFLLLISGL